MFKGTNYYYIFIYYAEAATNIQTYKTW